MQADVSVLHLPEDFPRHAAAFLCEEIQRAIAAHGLCRLGLCGGGTPRAIHEHLAILGAGLPWDHVQITFGDERCVPPDHAYSNYRMARESLLDRVAIPVGNVFRIRGEIPAEDAARESEARLDAVAARCGEARYVHDVLLLGVGEDGHTASLFPGSPALEETQRNVIPATGPKPPPQRVTMTFPLINAARHVVFLAADSGKRTVIDAILTGDESFPATRVRPARTTWLLGY